MAVSAAVAASAASAASAGYGIVKSRGDARDMRRDREQAQRTAAASANAKTIMQRQAMRDNNLLAGPPGARDTLGVS
jgi:hypothetical protein